MTKKQINKKKAKKIEIIEKYSQELLEIDSMPWCMAEKIVFYNLTHEPKDRIDVSNLKKAVEKARKYNGSCEDLLSTEPEAIRLKLEELLGKDLLRSLGKDPELIRFLGCHMSIIIRFEHKDYIGAYCLKEHWE